MWSSSWLGAERTGFNRCLPTTQTTPARPAHLELAKYCVAWAYARRLQRFSRDTTRQIISEHHRLLNPEWPETKLNIARAIANHLRRYPSTEVWPSPDAC